MKKILCLAALAPMLALASEVDGIAALVGKEAVLKSDVYQELQRLRLPESAYPDVRNEMIDRKLILKAARESKMTMQEWVVESRIREIIAKAFDGDRNKLMETLSRQKVSFPEWRQRIKDDMIVSAMRWSVVDKNAVARPSEMMKVYKAHPERYSKPGKATVSVILLKPADMEKRAEVSAALATNDFAAVAREFSVDSHAEQGGVWTDINPSDVFKPQVCEELSEMPLHTVSHWIEIDGWSFLLRKDAEEAGEKLTFEQAYDQIEADVRSAESKAAYDAWLERLRSETYIKVY